MTSIFTQLNKFVAGLVPLADRFSGTVNSAGVNLKLYGRATGLVVKGAGATGTTKLTVEACSNTGGTGATAIPFKYQVCTSGEAMGALQQAEAAGFDTTAGANQMYVIHVDRRDLPDGLSFVRIKGVEQVDSPCDGAIYWVLSEPDYMSDSLPAALT